MKYKGVTNTDNYDIFILDYFIFNVNRLSFNPVTELSPS